MAVVIIYGIIIFAACTIGATVGIGGGIIIKPTLDIIGIHSLDKAAFISSCAVLAMSASASAKHLADKTPVNKKTVILISVGSVLGGTAGNRVFDLLFNRISAGTIKGIQAICIILFIIFVLIYVHLKNKKGLRLKNTVLIIATGFLLGAFSAFLGIGGGPVNTAFLIILFSFTVKESSAYSVAIIFFSQLSQLITIFLNNRFEPYIDCFGITAAAMAAAVAGGIIGSKLNRKLSEKSITSIYTFVLIAVAIINIFNAVSGFSD